MAEEQDKESKTEDASEKKISDALEKGNVPFSREATLFASLLGVLACLTFFVAAPARLLTDDLARLIDDPGGFRLEYGSDAIDLLWDTMLVAGRFLTPMIIILAMAGLVAAVFQNVPSMVAERISPKWDRVSPASGFKRLFGIQGQIEFGKALFKLFAVGLVAGLVLYWEEHRLVDAMLTDPLLLPAAVLQLAMRLVSAVCVATIVLVGADLVWSRVHWKTELRMSRQEVKDEVKQAEGDPFVKARMRAVARQRARHRMMTAVPKATVVIANPTHYAIALKYDRDLGGAPFVLAKGLDLVALKIREIAEHNAIPVVEDRALARAMYDAVEVDQWIPREFYRPVAQVLHFIYSKRSNGPK
ncbi:flagellar biosynthesis protein FlhB [Xanthobacter agilis]|jgi:flagellar biosynthetic protein FlhB|uniref:Flagellar biosynthetic protein FlhB n=1 Tax=Xanthobacter agilis TaxID=47492 RepID=A0ABU0LHV6_XANAG|nr:flagellar biosynthesis protein FlhB [Xanthobacter agilis]MDQ0506672.1 flagellar biosynthetic protein FlhB [Xanthobacter agilis]